MSADTAHEFEKVAELFKTLSSPVRARLVHALTDGPLAVHELVDQLGLSQSLVSQHLRVLRGSRLVDAERQGREMVYALSDDHIAHILLDALHHIEEPDR
jgi:DNA-binding transcriptional ArsR family regulator